MGLFDGDSGSLADMLGPLLQSQSALNPIVPPPGGLPIPPPTPVQTEAITPTPPMGEPVPSAEPSIPGMPPTRMLGSTFGAGGPPPMGNGAGAPLSPPPGAIGAALRGEAIPGAAGPTALGSDTAGPMPLAPPSGTAGSTDIGARAKTDEEKRPSLAEALKGTVAPKPPELQKISSPNAPRPTGTIKGGDLQALLMALNAGAGNLNRQLPVTLGRG